MNQVLNLTLEPTSDEPKIRYQDCVVVKGVISLNPETAKQKMCSFVSKMSEKCVHLYPKCVKLSVEKLVQISLSTTSLQ